MQVGSLVICVQTTGGAVIVSGRTVQVSSPILKDEILTVDHIEEAYDHTGVKVLGLSFLEKPKTPHPLTGEVCLWRADHFREIQPPMDLSKILSNEKVTELVNS